MKKKIVITGANGQLGSQFSDYLDTNYDVYTFSSSEMDITDLDEVEKCMEEVGPEIILNCAAYTAVDLAETESEKAFLINEKGVQNLVEIAKKYGAKLVHFSTDYVFEGSDEDQKKYPNGYPEDAPKKPSGIYAKSKSAGEDVLLNSGYENYLLIRVAWLTGYYGKNFVKSITHLIKNRPQLNVVADQIGTPSYAENVVYNTDVLLKNDVKGVFHLGSTDFCSWYDIASEIRAWLGHKCTINPIPSSEYPTPVKRPHFSGLSTRKIQEIDGIKLYPWKPQLKSLLQELYS